MTDTMMKPQGENAVKLSAWDKATAALEGIYASKTIHLAPEPQGDRSGLSEPGKMVFPEQAIAQEALADLYQGQEPQAESSFATQIDDSSQDSPLSAAIAGDSMTVACGVERQDLGMMPRIAQNLADATQRDIHWEAHGKLGATMRRVRFRELPALRGKHYTLLYICAGSNDLMAQRSDKEWKDDLTGVLEVARGLANHVVVLSPGQVYKVPALGCHLRKAMLVASDRQTAMSKSVCDDFGVTYVDLTHEDVHTDLPDFYASDHFHPGKVGYQILADYISWRTLRTF